MDPLFSIHNSHRESPSDFSKIDPNLRSLSTQPLIHRPALLDRLPDHKKGIYTLAGGRQVGKTSLVKMWMRELLEAGTEPDRITYVTGELIDDHHSLVRILDEISTPGSSEPSTIVVDEVTYIRDWDRAIKYAADAGLLEDVVLLVTGSDMSLISEARKRFPGRRGSADTVDFHLRPLSFAEVIELTRPELAHLAELAVAPPEALDELADAFESYLVHGGYLTAINDVARDGRILTSTLATYSDWIRGDVLKRHRSESTLREVLGAVLRRLGSQVTYNALTRDLTIRHPATVAVYVELLEQMDVLFVQQALLEDRLTGAPRKARKISFVDPFIQHAVRSWLEPVNDPHGAQILASVEDPEQAARLAESCVASHYRRHHPTYYIKARGEVDIAYVHQGRFWPVEVKWRRRTRPGDRDQVMRYPNARILARTRTTTTHGHVPVEPLPLALLRLG